ncbi:MAG: hypothetical protein U5L09_06890 [Bacteroidales bacterium]|nr:hypothetical protein [Bacteroidales bacterium]
MKHFFTLTSIFLILFSWQQIVAQAAYSPLTDSLTGEITEESLLELENPLTGTTPTIIGGEEYTIATRHAYTEGNEKAAQWLFERLEDFGYEPWYHEFGSDGINVLAQKQVQSTPSTIYHLRAL